MEAGRWCGQTSRGPVYLHRYAGSRPSRQAWAFRELELPLDVPPEVDADVEVGAGAVGLAGMVRAVGLLSQLPMLTSPPLYTQAVNRKAMKGAAKRQRLVPRNCHKKKHIPVTPTTAAMLLRNITPDGEPPSTNCSPGRNSSASRAYWPITSIRACLPLSLPALRFHMRMDRATPVARIPRP